MARGGFKASSHRRKKATDKGLELMSPAKGAPRWLKGDATCIQQIPLNLVSNAIRFTSHGYVRVEASPRVLSDGAIEPHPSLGLPRSRHARKRPRVP
jgi:hypothetical protein